VLFQNTLQLTDALQQAGKVFDLLLYPQKSHSVTGPAARQMNASMLEFFDRWLK
jgi:dipeptidyl-peptidase-4